METLEVHGWPTGLRLAEEAFDANPVLNQLAHKDPMPGKMELGARIRDRVFTTTSTG